jgi:hypothetical protein
MALRVTRQYADSLGDGAGKLRATRQYVNTVGPGVGKLRATRQYVNGVGPGVGAIRVSRQFADALGASDGKLRVSRQYLQVLASADTNVINVDTADVVSLSEQTERVYPHYKPIVIEAGAERRFTTGDQFEIPPFLFPIKDGVSGEVLETDGTGKLAWVAKGQEATASRLINGGFDFFQRQTPATLTSRTDDTYGPDRWAVLTQSNSVQVARIAGAAYSAWQCRMKQHQTLAQRMGLLQIVEYNNSKSLRDGIVGFQATLTSSVTQTVRYAVLEWTGTADTVTSDVVNSWTSVLYTPGNFFLGSNLVVTAIGSTVLTAGVATDVRLSGTISALCNNAIVFIWTENVVAKDTTLDVAEVGLYPQAADYEQDWKPRFYGDELALCQRYYEKSYNVDIAPATATRTGAFGSCSRDAWWVENFMVRYATTKRISVSPTLYSPYNGEAGHSGEYNTVQVFNANRALQIIEVGMNGFGIASGAGDFNIYDVQWFQWIADAEL